VLDDAFQHIRLERDIDLVLLDAERPFGNGNLFPRGILREPQDALQRATAVVLTRAAKGGAEALGGVKRHAPEKPVFQCVHRAYIAGIVPAQASGGPDTPATEAASGLDAIKGRGGYIFSGIARNERVQENLEQAGLHVCGTSFFDDHHWYAREELKEIARSAKKKGAELIITTQKDFARIPQTMSWPLDLVVVGVDVLFPDDGFDLYIQRELRGIKKDGSAW
jgi:tetraacyldisaccharide 4'-kinase